MAVLAERCTEVERYRRQEKRRFLCSLIHEEDAWMANNKDEIVKRIMKKY